MSDLQATPVSESSAPLVLYNVDQEWVPVASRLASATPEGEQQPLLPSDQLPPLRRLDQPYTNRIQPGTVRYSVPSHVKLLQASEQIAAGVSIRVQLARHFPDDTPAGSVIFTRKPGMTLMDIVWNSDKPFDPDTPLELEGEKLVFLAAPCRERANWITVRVQHIPDSMVDSACTALKAWAEPHKILDFWRTVVDFEVDNNAQTMYTGTLYLLMELNMMLPSASGVFTSLAPANHPDEVAHQLPTTFEHKGEKFEVMFAARADHCKFCSAKTGPNSTYCIVACEHLYCTKCGFRKPPDSAASYRPTWSHR